MSTLSELLPAAGDVGATDFTASGAIASGKPVILNSDGTVTEVAMASSTQAVPATGASFANWWDDSKNQRDWSSYGAAAVHRNRYDMSVSLADSNKAVIIAMTEGSVQGTVCVVTRSGTTMTAGDHVTYMSGNASSPYDNRHDQSIEPKVACGTVENQFLIIYRKNSAFGGQGAFARVGTIDGDTCTLGTETVVQSGSPSGDAPSEGCFIAADPNADNKYVVGWVDGSSPRAKVATVSGTNVSFGSNVQYSSVPKGSARADIAFNPASSLGQFAFTNGQYSASSPDICISTYSGTTMGTHANATYIDCGGGGGGTEQGEQPRIAFDASNGNMVICYRSHASSGYGAVRVIEQDGTINTKVIISSTGLGPYHHVRVTDVAGDPNNTGKFCLTYSTQNDDTIHFRSFYTSGSSGSITCNLDSAITVVSESSGAGTSPYVSTTPQAQVEYWGSDDGKIAIQYTGKAGQHDEEWVGVGQAAGASVSNLTSSNLLGISSAAISNTASGTINTWGSISNVHSSLSISTDYYAQADGTLSDTSASPAQLVGKAINATTINIKDYTG